MPTKTNVRPFFLVIEGSDASGKSTQVQLLLKRLQAENWTVNHFDFPRYHQTSSYFVKKYLKGDYGPLKSIDAKTASLFFALDRFDIKNSIQKALKRNEIVLCNRFFASNLAHQGAKINNEQKRQQFLKWAYDLEFEILKIPPPDLNIILDVPLKISLKLLTERALKEDKKLDLHEKDLKQQTISRQIYQSLCHQAPQQYKYISCVNQHSELLDKNQIHQLVWQTVSSYLK